MSRSDEDTIQSTLTWAEPAGASPAAATPEGAIRERYVILGPIGRGGMGEVLRVHDQRLDTNLAMKILAARLADSDRAQERFLHEVRITAQLRHPGIVSVHDRGVLDDGRPWFTMTEVRGRTLQEVIDEAHATPGGGTLRSLIDVIRRAAEAMAYAHKHGVIHRDIKPSNVMVGEFGEVFVMDWGLARRLSSMPDGPSDVTLDEDRSLSTRYGDVIGTPSYMPIEQAQGETDTLDCTADVYSLGAVLYAALSGKATYSGGNTLSVMSSLLEGPPPPLARRLNPELPVPNDLITTCERAMKRNPAERFESASGLVRALTDWLDGAARLEEAQVAVNRAANMRPEIDALSDRAHQLTTDANELLAQVKPNDPVSRKRTAWMLLDQADDLLTQAAFQEAIWLQTVRSALNRVADFAPAHQILGEHYKGRLIEAESLGRRADAAKLETLLRGHNLGEHTAFLDGRAWVSLQTNPSGATASLYRFVARDRRQELQFVRELGPTPLRQVELTHGSYVIRIEHPGHDSVLYPIRVGRLEHWDGIRPGLVAAQAIPLPPAGALKPDEVYVPAGWCSVGGDPDAIDGLKPQQVWVDAFILDRRPVSIGEYLQFLNDLARIQGVEAARAHAPKAHEADMGRSLVAQSDGRFAAGVAHDGVRLKEEWPVELVGWRDARAFATWRSTRSDRTWDLPSELAWEKAARGVDGRPFPWGAHFDATWANMVEHYDIPRRTAPAEHPLDCSPYGVLGMGGGVRDWCLDVWRADGPAVHDRVLARTPADAESPDFRVVRGGSWQTVRGGVRAAARFAGLPDQRFTGHGFRLARWLDPGHDGRILW